MTDSEYPNLFSNFELAGNTLKNRIIHSAMSTRFAKNGDVTEELINYHRSRAQGGAAILIAEPLAMRRDQASNTRVRVFDQNNLDKLKVWSESIRKHDSYLLTQIQEPGRGHHKSGRKIKAIGPSSLPDDLSWTVPEALEKDAIYQMIDDFILSSKKLMSAGFSGVEISAGHGHIFHQFLSPWSNHRNDDFGGSIENRVKILIDLISGIRSACSKNFIIGLRLPGDDFVEGGIDETESSLITDLISLKTKVDFFCWVQGGHHRSLEMHLPDMHFPRGTYLPLIKRLKNSTNGVPVAAVGRILEPVQAETLISDGVAELVMLGRTLVTDAAWGLKSLQNRDNDIRKCVSCNNCWGVINQDQPLQCDNNPRVGFENEIDWLPEKSIKKKKVVIVGGGISGLEAAWVSAAKGHDVTLFSSSDELGGKCKLNATIPGCETLSSIYDYQKVMISKFNVDIRLNWFATSKDVLDLKPEEIIIATGGKMLWPSSLPEQYKNDGIILDLRDVTSNFLSVKSRVRGNLVIYDADGMDGTYSAAEYLNSFFDKVFIITERELIGRDEPVVRTQSILRRIYNAGIEIISLSIPSKKSNFENGLFVYKNVITNKEDIIEDVSLFTYSTQREPDQLLYKKLKNHIKNIYLIGDACIPRSAMISVQQGHYLANTL